VPSAPTAALIRVYMRLPAIGAVAPPTIDVVRVLHLAVRNDRSHNAVEAQLALLEVAADVVRDRLLRNDIIHAEDLKESVEALSDSFQEQVLSLLSAGRVKGPQLLGRAGTLLKRCEELTMLKEACAGVQCTEHERVIDNTVEPWMGWINPTVRWLTDGRWLAAPGLSKRYEDPTAYAKTLHQIMTLLTFYWGAGAVWPRCRQKSGELKCNEPLLSMSHAPSRTCTMPISRSKCANLAMWCCPRAAHQDAICASCLRHRQHLLCGPPGSQASTDIYDAVVETELIRREGQVMSALNSRSLQRVSLVTDRPRTLLML
jgi:hypothetical protein